MEKSGAKVTQVSLADQYCQNVTLSRESEPITDNLVGNILSIAKKVLPNPKIMKAIELAEKRRGANTPYGSVLQMYLLSNRGETDEGKARVCQ